MLLPFQGVGLLCFHSQGDALGYERFAPSGRITYCFDTPSYELSLLGFLAKASGRAERSPFFILNFNILHTALTSITSLLKFRI